MKLTPDQRIWVSKVLAAISAIETGPSEADLADAPVLGKRDADPLLPFLS